MYTDFYGIIDVNYIKLNSPIAATLQDEFIDPYIVMAQEKHLLPILGTTLYNDIQSQISDYINSGTSISDTYILLINNYLKNTLLHWSLYELLPFCNYKITNIAIAKKSSEFSQPSDLSEMNYLRNSIKSTAQFYSERLEEHLKMNYTLYPKFYEYTQNTDTTTPQKTNTFCGIYLGKNI